MAIMTILGVAVFVGASVLSIAAIAMSIAPQWRRILRLASGQVETSFMPLRQLAQAEQRIAVRRWASHPVPASIHRLREAA